MNTYKLNFYVTVTNMMTIEVEGETEDEACDKFYDDFETNIKLSNPIKGSFWDNVDADIHEVILIREGDDD